METYLKHLSVALIVAFAGVGVLLHPEWANEAWILWAMILGYVFKNGSSAYAKTQREPIPDRPTN